MFAIDEGMERSENQKKGEHSLPEKLVNRDLRLIRIDPDSPNH
jgi:hypothetical protein